MVRMRVEMDEAAFDAMQRALVRKMARTLRRVLQTTGLSKARVRDITEDLTFLLCALLDGSAEVELDGLTVEPQLTFRGIRPGTLITARGPSWMHEYAFGSVREVFESGVEDGVPTRSRPAARKRRKR